MYITNYVSYVKIMPLVKKCYHCKVKDLTKIKRVALEHEYDNLQHYLQTKEDLGLYSAIKQQADRFYKIWKTEYPLSIRNNLIRIEHKPSTVAEYWIRGPVGLIRGGLWIGIIKPYEPISRDAKICECKLYKRDNRWFLDVVVEKNIPERLVYQNVIGVDMGIRHIAASVELASGKTGFYGKNLNRVRGHYWLRRKLGMKAIDTIKKIGNHETRITNDIVYNISRWIVNRAIESNALIALGDIKHLRRHNTNRKFNRKLAGFQYYNLTHFIKYKAALAGIRVIQVSEKWTSQYCRKCYQKGVRKTQGLFQCSKCGEDNADRNAAFNIGHRGLGHASNLGITVSISRTFHSIDVNAMMRKEATDFNRW
jgi:putative transposase